MRLLVALGLSLGMSVAAQAHGLKVATSFSILEDMVKNVVGEHGEVISLVGADADVHHYEFKPSDVKAFADNKEIKVLFTNGLELDGWAEQLAKAAQFKGKVVALSDGIKTRAFNEEVLGEHDHGHGDHKHGHDDHKHDSHGHKHDDHKHDHHKHDDHKHDNNGHKHDDHGHEGHHHGHEGHAHGEFDPHAWQSLSNAQIYVDNIVKTLSEIDADHADLYAKNAAAYKEKMQALDTDFKAKFATLPANHRYLVTSHEALGYFADAYGLKVLTPLGFADNAEPSAKDIATVVKAIRELKVPAVFLENTKNPKVVEQIARESQTKVGGTLYTDALAKEGAANSYLGMMEQNAKTILEALK
ncbi:MAG: zinc ABC transporter substrate-binding protein [Pelistega sp.]|nr:zinc ABC transporter substrate-binding protein [Pelistega sp.]